MYKLSTGIHDQFMQSQLKYSITIKILVQSIHSNKYNGQIKWTNNMLV